MDNITKLVSDLVNLASSKKNKDTNKEEDIKNIDVKNDDKKDVEVNVNEALQKTCSASDDFEKDIKIEEMEKKFIRTITSLKSKIAELEQELEKKHKRSKPAAEDKLEAAEKELSHAQDSVVQAQEDLAEAKLIRDVKALAQARRDYKKALRELRLAETALAKVQDMKEREKARGMAEKIQQFYAGLQRAVEKFPQLLDEKGQLDADSPIIKRAVELMREHEADSSFLFDPEDGSAIKINPRYDNVDGQYNAIRDAIDELDDKQEQDIKRIRYEKNVLNKRLIKERSKKMDPASSAFVPGASCSVTTLRKKLDEAEKSGDIAQFQRIRMHIEKLEKNRKDS